MIKRVVLENWKSHRSSEFEFGKGTNILIGSVGSGKTSVMDAICFALFGTYPSLQAKRISLEETIMRKPSAMESAKVRLEFEYQGKDYAVERTVYRGKSKSNQAKLYRDSEFVIGPKPTDVTEKIESILELDYHLFSRAVYSEQNQIDYFLRLTPRQRKEKFDELLALNRYENARSNAVTVLNRVRRMNEDKRRFLDEQQAKVNLQELESLKKKLADKEKAALELAKSKKEKEKRLAQLEKEIKVLAEKEARHKALNESLIKLKAVVEEQGQVVEALEFETGKTLSELRKTALVREKDNCLKELKALGQEKEKMLSLKNKVALQEEKKQLAQSNANSLLKRMPAQVKTVQEAALALAKAQKNLKAATTRLEGLEKEKEAVQEQVNAAAQELNFNRNKLKEIENILTYLTKAEADCPVCKRPLGEHSQQELLKENKLEKTRLAKAGQELEKRQAELKEKLAQKKKQILEQEKQVSELRERQRQLEDLDERLAEISRLQKEIKQAGKALEKDRKELSEAEQKFKPELQEKLEAKVKGLERLLEGLSLLEKLDQLKKQAQSAEKDLEKLDFEESVLRGKKDLFARGQAEASSIDRELATIKEFSAQVRSSVESMEKTRRQLVELKESIENAEALQEKMTLFINALKAAQSELRESLIGNINLAMDDIWSRLYPYHDYLSAKIEIVDGNYELMVKERSGQWIRVEGVLSGGERSAAALALRIAFSLVLTQNLSWLILDEPTHNLDTSTVKELSAMMREHLPELVQQIFVITHDKEMEKAASATLYFLERNKGEDGVTIPVLQQIE